jgi:small conductance mechanosensitive channel
MKTKVLQTPTRSFVKTLLLKWQCTPWATKDYGAVFTETLENCKTAFDAAGIVIQPYLKEMSSIKLLHFLF